MQPLRICFLWHQHQPDYRVDGEFFLPWVRLHAAKDYTDLLHIIQSYPLKHTINVVPTLISQLESYERGFMDRVQELCAIPSEHFTLDLQDELLEWCRTLQFKTMVSPFPKLRSIWSDCLEAPSVTLTTQDVTNLKAMFNLAWIGPIARRASKPLSKMLLQTKDFTASDVALILDEHLRLCKSFMPALNDVQKTENVEVSITPYNHPILPLLIDTDAAIESNPLSTAPQPPLRNPKAARRQVGKAIEFWNEHSPKPAAGMWSAEGAISSASVGLLAEHGIKWTASDEAVLRKSLGDEWDETSTYFPYVHSTEHGDIALLFRDHSLSDAIGFEYSGWDSEVAADDFIRRLEERRRILVMNYGESVLSDAVVPIFLDGENCWEFYEGNGEPFLRSLFERLSNNARFQTVTCSEAVNSNAKRQLRKIVPGSWINGDFGVWIGTEVKNVAWSLLKEAHDAVAGLAVSSTKSPLLDELHTRLMILEASDWFWWYHDQHIAPHKTKFDEMFRLHLRFIFENTRIMPGVALQYPLSENNNVSTANVVPIVFATGSMHDANAACNQAQIETQDDWQRITIWLRRELKDDEKILLLLVDNSNVQRNVMITSDAGMINSTFHNEGFEWRSRLQASIYVHAAEWWQIKVEEQRSGGFKAVASIEIS
ncbi:MAG: hypothetical protein HQ472_02630 [Ignavibacteria bacterium]|nr:hypothetical protein [Ignavibacteria bacterium]